MYCLLLDGQQFKVCILCSNFLLKNIYGNDIKLIKFLSISNIILLSTNFYNYHLQYTKLVELFKSFLCFLYALLS